MQTRIHSLEVYSVVKPDLEPDKRAQTRAVACWLVRVERGGVTPKHERRARARQRRRKEREQIPCRRQPDADRALPVWAALVVHMVGVREYVCRREEHDGDKNGAKDNGDQRPPRG